MSSYENSSFYSSTEEEEIFQIEEISVPPRITHHKNTNMCV